MIAEEPKQAVSPESIAEDVRMIESMEIIPEILNVICRTTGMRFAAVARVTDEKWVTCSTQDEIGFGLKPGDELKLQTTICDEIRQSGKAVIIDHVAEDPDFCGHHTPAMYGFQSYISFPIMRKSGEFFGTLCAIDPKPNKLKTEEVVNMFLLFSDLISFHLQSAEHSIETGKQMQAERALHKKIEEKEEKLNIVIDASELGTWDINFITGDFHCAGKYAEIMGYKDVAELPSLEMLRNRLHSADHTKREEAYKIAFETGRLYFTGRMVWPDQTIHWVESKGKVFFDENKKPLRMMGVVRDITSEKNFELALEEKVKSRTAELHEKNDELEKMNRELHSFTYISGHDLQEPLRKIQTFISLIEAEPDNEMPDKVKDYFGRIQKAANRMQLLILDLLEYSRATTEEKKYEPTDINIIIEQVKENMKEEIRQKNATVNVSGLCMLNIIPFQMRQLFQNLLSNSLKFSKPDIAPVINIESEIGLGAQFKGVKLQADKEYCLIRFTDNGIGFEEDYNEKVFELFQRLHGKAAYNGTGIGLAIVKKITENHGGIIKAEGNLNKGAAFNIYLPIDDAGPKD